MFIGSLLSPESGLKPTVKTFKRGTSIPLPSEREDSYGWSWQAIQDQGVDFAVDFGKTVYVDSILYALEKGSRVNSASVLVDGKTVADTSKLEGHQQHRTQRHACAV